MGSERNASSAGAGNSNTCRQGPQRMMLMALALIATLTAAESAVLLGLISHYIPFAPDPLLQTIFIHYRRGFVPERELGIYLSSLAIGCLIFAVLWMYWHKRPSSLQTSRNLWAFAGIQTLLLGVEVYACLMIILDQFPGWALDLLVGTLSLSLLSKAFAGQVRGYWERVRGRKLFQPPDLAKIILRLNPTMVKTFYVSLLWACQILLITGRIFPLHPPGGWVLFAGSSLAAVLLIKKFPRILEHRIFAPLTPYILLESALTLLLYAAFVQKTAYSLRPWMAQNAFDLLLTTAVVVKVFWPQLIRACGLLYSKILSLKFPAYVPDTAVLGTIFLILFIPDPEAVVAWLFMGDYFHAWDVVFMGTVYGIFNGLTPSVDVLSTYGLGLPVFLSLGAKVLGGFDYANVLRVLVFVGIAYYGLWYLLLKRIFQSRAVAFAAVVLGMRAQMFLAIVVPLVWNEAQASVYRYCFDIGFFWCLWSYEQGRKPGYLWGMVLFSALGIYHMPTTGMTLFCALILYFLLNTLRNIFQQSRKGLKQSLPFLPALAAVPVLAFSFAWLTVEYHIFGRSFWDNVTEFTSYFSHGFFYSSMLSPLRSGEFALVGIGLLFPLFYLFTALYTGARYCLDPKDSRSGFLCTLAFYGLGLFVYYVGMSHKYYSVGLPAIFLLFEWINQGLRRLKEAQRPKAKIFIVGICVYALATTHMFMAYPNLLNFSRNPIVDEKVAQRVGRGVYYFNQLMADYPEAVKLPLNSLGEKDEALKYEKDFPTHAQLKAFYRQQTAFTEDAALIQKYTQPTDTIPLLSSFEILILAKAQRKPFFYYFPLLNSRPLTVRNFMVTTIFSAPQLSRCLQRMEEQKPPYLFMERIFLTPQVPEVYFYEYEDLITLIRYGLAHYTPVAYGKYLVAMKRID